MNDREKISNNPIFSTLYDAIMELSKEERRELLREWKDYKKERAEKKCS